LLPLICACISTVWQCMIMLPEWSNCLAMYDHPT
jgi:hypothetical protein